VEFCRQQPLGTISFAIICAMMIAGIFCEWVAPYDPLAIDFASLLMAPSSDHWCGTDAFGRDICSRLIYGSRTALVIGFTSSFFGSSIGAILGIASAYFGGRIDNWIQRVVDVLLAFPIIVLALVVVAAFGKLLLVGIDVNLIFAIAIPIVPRVARVVRAAALSVRVMPYIDAARAAGYSHTGSCRRWETKFGSRNRAGRSISSSVSTWKKIRSTTCGSAAPSAWRSIAGAAAKACPASRRFARSAV
jgi:peptide/nickel transport system permease protein